ncbi:hypothetical protein C8A05DRAFT_19942 [Staphylotrichum tortipilum]|uniref:Uncharacterized protein n=1 Tax=Staphylotrichum tortipilum TaxID=2831512 RepID=A0AAN6RPC8_9PEZI|nr:hypothetical protein C8A05DRAFT_19942 [Staphylotrichum longicolle]
MDRIPVVSQFRGHITAPPPADSPLAYKENVIVNLMIQILTMLISIGHIQAERILFAPPGGHTDIDEAVCAELNLGPRVVSLLKRLPYWTSSEFIEWAQIRPDSYLPNYRDPEHLRLGRRVCGLPIDTIRRSDNSALVLDHIRQEFPDYVPEFPEEAVHYRNRVALHAPTVLADYVEDLRRLEFMPTGGLGTGEATVVSTGWEPGMAVVREALLQQYGWPDEFGAEEWRQEGRAIYEAARQGVSWGRGGFRLPLNEMLVPGLHPDVIRYLERRGA